MIPFRGLNRNSPALRYGVALAGVGLAVVIRTALDPYLGDAIPYPPFFGAVVLAAWFGGFGPGLLGAAAGA